jgi:hypothetical protein
MAYADLAAELSGLIPGLSPILAATMVRRAWRDIRNERNWSFKTGQASLVCPAQIVTGTVALTQYSATVTFSATATTALTPFVAGTPLLTQLQIRFSNGPIYRIVAVTQTAPVIIVTLDRPVIEATNPAATYSVYRAYVSPPVADFVAWESFEDYANARTLKGNALTRTSVEFDVRDPSRSSAGTPDYLGFVVAETPTGVPLYELWPHPSGGCSFLVTFKRRGPEFVAAADAQPDVISDSLIMERALGWYGYHWAQANKGRFPVLQKSDFLTLIKDTQAQYLLDLNTHRLRDEDIALQSVYNRGHWGGGRSHRPDGPIGDAKYWQSHPIYW